MATLHAAQRPIYTKHLDKGVIGSREGIGREAEGCNRKQVTEESEEIPSEGFDPGAGRRAKARS
jgi:hypothetical protein